METLGQRCGYNIWGHYDMETLSAFMMTSSNGNSFRVTGPLCGEYTGHRCILRTKASDAELWCFPWSLPFRTQPRDRWFGAPWRTLWRHCNVTVPLKNGIHLSSTDPLTKGQGWGLLSQFPPFRYFPNFSVSLKHTLPIEYRVYIWQVSPQLSCGGTCQI